MICAIKDDLCHQGWPPSTKETTCSLWLTWRMLMVLGGLGHQCGHTSSWYGSINMAAKLPCPPWWTISKGGHGWFSTGYMEDVVLLDVKEYFDMWESTCLANSNFLTGTLIHQVPACPPWSTWRMLMVPDCHQKKWIKTVLKCPLAFVCQVSTWWYVNRCVSPYPTGWT